MENSKVHIFLGDYREDKSEYCDFVFATRYGIPYNVCWVYLYALQRYVFPIINWIVYSLYTWKIKGSR